MKKRLEYLKSNGFEVIENKNGFFIAANKYLTIENTPKAFIITKNPDYTWSNADIKMALEDLNIAYGGGLFAILIEERKMNRPLYILGMEDDDRIFFEKYDKTQWTTSFDMNWSGDLINVINKAHELVWSKEENK